LARPLFKGHLITERGHAEAAKKSVHAMTLVKTCGITSLDDARAAIAAGADMLGFNFYRPSPRFVEPSKVRKMIESLRVETGNRPTTTVGVFVNETSPASLMEIVAAAGVDAVQLHGDESVEFCQSLKQLLNGRLLIKVIRVAETFAPSDAQQYDADAIMLDAFHGEMRGGTGRVFDWAIARAARDLVPRLFLAGGLSAANVAQAIAEVDPYAVDACSSLESSPGKKDAERMRAFVQAVRNG
jgi:phosphoribosylanthranilate isomerase